MRARKLIPSDPDDLGDRLAYDPLLARLKQAYRVSA
jgi:hypothetical protein